MVGLPATIQKRTYFYSENTENNDNMPEACMGWICGLPVISYFGLLSWMVGLDKLLQFEVLAE